MIASVWSGRPGALSFSLYSLYLAAFARALSGDVVERPKMPGTSQSGNQRDQIEALGDAETALAWALGVRDAKVPTPKIQSLYAFATELDQLVDTSNFQDESDE
jgi:hypothetical protein